MPSSHQCQAFWGLAIWSFRSKVGLYSWAGAGTSHCSRFAVATYPCSNCVSIGRKKSVSVNINLYTWFTEFDLISTGPVQRNSKRQQECSPIPRIQRWHSESSRYTGTFPVRSIYPCVELDHVCGLELRVRLPSLRCIGDLPFLCNYIRYI
jgi:hypothetical protein